MSHLNSLDPPLQPRQRSQILPSHQRTTRPPPSSRLNSQSGSGACAREHMLVEDRQRGISNFSRAVSWAAKLTRRTTSNPEPTSWCASAPDAGAVCHWFVWRQSLWRVLLDRKSQGWCPLLFHGVRRHFGPDLGARPSHVPWCSARRPPGCVAVQVRSHLCFGGTTTPTTMCTKDALRHVFATGPSRCGRGGPKCTALPADMGVGWAA